MSRRLRPFHVIACKRLAAFYPATNKDRVFTAYEYAKDRMRVGLILSGADCGGLAATVAAAMAVSACCPV